MPAIVKCLRLTGPLDKGLDSKRLTTPTTGGVRRIQNISCHGPTLEARTAYEGCPGILQDIGQRQAAAACLVKLGRACVDLGKYDTLPSAAIKGTRPNVDWLIGDYVV